MDLTERELEVIGEALGRVAERYASNAQELRDGMEHHGAHPAGMARYGRLALRFEEQQKEALSVREKVTLELERRGGRGSDAG